MNSGTDEKMLDIKMLMVSADNDPVWADELFELFKADTTERIGLVGKVLSSGSVTDSIARHFHTIKGSSASVGAMQLRDHAIELEMFAKEGRYEEIAEKFNNFKDIFERTIEFFKHNFKKEL